MVCRINMDADSFPSDWTINSHTVVKIDLINAVFVYRNGIVLSVKEIFFILFITNIYYNMNNLN